MYRGSKQKPVSNSREHIQRNQYARTALQRRRLFQNSNSNKNKLLYIVIAFVCISSLFYWGSTGEDADQNGPLKSSSSSIASKTTPGSTSRQQNSNASYNGQTAKHEVPLAVPQIQYTSSMISKVNGKVQAPEEHHDEMHPIDPDDVPKHANTLLESEPFDDFKCSFRKYKPHRYYPVDDLTEKFLADSDYIRGKLPFVINPNGNGGKPKKLCTDTSAWEKVLPNHRPFTDGQNPSFVSLAHNAYGKVSDKPRIEKSTIEPLFEIYGEEAVENLFLGLLLFGDSQCRWNMSTEELKSSRFSPLQEAPSKRSLVMILNEHLDPVGRAVLELEHDAPWGDKRKKHGVKKKKDGSGYDTSIVELDDARLFFHKGILHVLYRNGPSFGYEKQIQNPIHLEKLGDSEFRAVIKASESFSVCCGRNIAFISEVPSDNLSSEDLQALTWVDPVTTEVVEYPSVAGARRLMDVSHLNNKNERRRLGNKLGSAIHGTNGYLVPLHGTNELLGVAHFHRPEHREQSDYARHGHHYTHAFFTLEQTQVTAADSSEESKKFVLKRLSNEFVFMAPSSRNKNAADVIQFASGLDLVGSDQDGKLMISYGINDCEAAIVFLEMNHVQELLSPVEAGTEVLHLMKKLSFTNL